MMSPIRRLAHTHCSPIASRTMDISPQVDPQVFVGRLEGVDIANIVPEDMKCSHCWDDFGHVEDETIKLRNAKVKADNAPFKMLAARPPDW